MADVYQVVTECAYVTQQTTAGKATILMMKGSLVPADSPSLKHLLDNGFVVKVGGDETGGLNADGVTLAEANADDKSKQDTANETEAQDDGGKDDESPVEDAAVTDRRNTAREKLSKLGGKVPDGRQGDDVLVEYLVGRGYRYEDISKADKAELLDLVKQSQN